MTTICLGDLGIDGSKDEAQYLLYIFVLWESSYSNSDLTRFSHFSTYYLKAEATIQETVTNCNIEAGCLRISYQPAAVVQYLCKMDRAMLRGYRL